MQTDYLAYCGTAESMTGIQELGNHGLEEGLVVVSRRFRGQGEEDGDL